jgi:hypothetical protein
MALSFIFLISTVTSATIQEIYIVQLTHLDIGFTAPPDDVADECKERIDQVLGYLDIYPQFKWTIENIWQLEQWLNRTYDPEELQKLFDYVRDGRISIGGGYANMHSSMLGYEEMNRFFYPAQRLRKEFDIDIMVMLMNDVPGWSWAIPQAAAKSDIGFLLTGPNTWLGGAADIPLSDRPFYYEGPDGSRILTWMGYGAYLEGTFDYYLHSSQSQMEEKVLARIQEWESAGYPYDAILILDGTGDNGMANNVIGTFGNVEWWNANHTSQMILSTPEEFFRHMEETYHGSFPVYSGDSAGLWAGAVNSAVPVSQGWVRIAGDRILSGEKLAAINYLNGEEFPSDQIKHIYQSMHTFDEHSGAGTGWPGMLTKEEIDRSNEIDFETAQRAYTSSESLLNRALRELGDAVGSDSPAILVFNPLSWVRTDIVRVQLPQAVYKSGFILRDDVTMKEIPYERLENQTIEFTAVNVPPVGYKLYSGESVSDPPVYKDRVILSNNNRTIENDFYRVSISPEGLSIWDKDSGRELVNHGGDFSFNGVLRSTHMEDFFGIYHNLSSGPVTISGDPGPISGELVIDFISSCLAKVQIILYGDIKRIDLVNSLDKGRMPFVPYARHSEHYYFTFPFDLDITDRFQVSIENPDMFIHPDRDYLPGAFVGNFVSQHVIDMRETDGFGVMMANRESFLNEIGSTYHRNLIFQPDEATIVTRSIQKIDQGETSDQGIVTITSLDNGIEMSDFHYAITSSHILAGSLREETPAESARFGWSFNNPLEALLIRGNPGSRAHIESDEESFFNLSHDNVILVSVKKAEFNGDSDIILRIQEIGGISSPGVQLLAAYPFSHAELNTTTEESIPGVIFPTNPIIFDIEPHETLTIRAR